MAADNARNPNADDAALAESGGNLLVNSAIIAVICGAAAFGVVFFLAPSGATESAACAVEAMPASTSDAVAATLLIANFFIEFSLEKHGKL